MVDKRRIAVAVAVLAAVAAGPVWLWYRDPVRRLVSGTPQNRRPIEARLTGGFAWASLQAPMRSADSPPTQFEMRLGGATWQTLAATSDDHSPRARHAAALALLLERRFRPAMAILEQLVTAQADEAELWSDLAAARCEVARAEDDPSLLGGCLAAADAALELDQRLHEARFNRAVVLEQLGLRDVAREAWLAYAADEPDRRWAEEGRERARALPPVVPFKDIIEKTWEQLADDPAAARALARERPQDARLWGETRILRWWADAQRAGDRAKAERALRLARELGDAIERRSGESMLKRAVAAIDDASPEALQHLADAHIGFDAAQQLFKADQAAGARSGFETAARAFELGRSPLSLVAQYYIAHTFYVEGDTARALERERELLETAPAEYLAYRAHLLWHLGLGYQVLGEWGRSTEAVREALTLFERLGEPGHIAMMHSMFADIHDRTGDPASAWKERIIMLRYAGRESTFRLQQMLDVIARAAMSRREWPVAFSFLDLAGDVATRIDRPLLIVETRVLQARAFATAARANDAGAAIESARAAAARIKDKAVREGAMADVLAAEAIVAPVPDRAVALLTRAIDFHRTRGRKVNLPDMFLRRGRAFQELGDRERAAADFEAGIAEVELYRKSLPPGAARWGIFNTAEELFEDAVALALQEREPARAFRYAERARARELSEALNAAIPTDALPDIGKGTVLVEFVALPDRLVTFVLEHGRLRAVEQKVDRNRLHREVEAFRTAVREDSEDLRTHSRAMYDRLIAPVAAQIGPEDAIVVVSGPPLTTIPFTALTRPDGRFLIEQNTIVTAPSAAVYEQLAARARPIRRDARLLVMADPVTDMDRLPASRKEAKTLAAMYGGSTPLVGPAATVEAFRQHAADAEVIHIATHGVSTGVRGRAALVMTGGRLELGTIASTPLPNTAAVVLGACSTADGASGAEGVISVGRAFLEAGAPAVIATLWPVNDAESAQFFPIVHGHLEAGLPPAVAVREAQRGAIQRRLSPALWAAVECMGSAERRFSN